ncbi:integrase, partial [Amycolatopsis sp. SID8362]|nr:integrase [Amycolatopsis sp. SID8362]NED40930.1 integrase [Amycolatopsis sp. SID8362]
MPDLHPVPDAALAAASPQDRLALLDEAAARHVDGQRPANTLKAYAQDWQVWQDYTAEAGIPPLSATIGALTGFVVWLERGRTLRPDERAVPEVPELAAPAAPSTIERRLTG